MKAEQQKEETEGALAIQYPWPVGRGPLVPVVASTAAQPLSRVLCSAVSRFVRACLAARRARTEQEAPGNL